MEHGCISVKHAMLYNGGETTRIEITEIQANALREAIDIVLESGLANSQEEAERLRQVSRKLVLASADTGEE